MSRTHSLMVLSVALFFSALAAIASVAPAAALDVSPTYPTGEECGCKFGV
jgi:hypothetical protein